MVISPSLLLMISPSEISAANGIVVSAARLPMDVRLARSWLAIRGSLFVSLGVMRRQFNTAHSCGQNCSLLQKG
jgi:hypothetical protein